MSAKRLASFVLSALIALAVMLVPARALALSTEPIVYEQLGFTLDPADIEVSPELAYPGDTVTVSLTCESHDVVAMRVYLSPVDGGNAYKMVTITDPDGDGTFTGTTNVYEGTVGGDWHVSYILVYLTVPGAAAPDIDISNHEGTDNGYYFYRDLSAGNFTIVSEDADTTPPVVLVDTIEVSPKRATVGDTVTCRIEAYDDFGMSTSPNAGVVFEYRGLPDVRLTQTEPGVFEGSFTVVAGMTVGEHELHNIRSFDDAGNQGLISDQRYMWPERDFSAGDVELYDIPGTDGLFTVDFEHATRTPADAQVQPGTRVWFTVPVSATNGVKSVSMNFYASHTWSPADLTDNGDGTWTGSVFIPATGASGKWWAGSITVTDNTGATYTTYTKEHYGDSYPSAAALAFTVPYPSQGEPEENPPYLDFEASSQYPKVVRRDAYSPSNGTSHYVFVAGDDSGVKDVRFLVAKPGDTIEADVGGHSYGAWQSSDGNWICNISVGPDLGTYRLFWVEVTDVHDNVTTYKNSYYYPDDPNACDLSMFDFEFVNDNDGVGPTVDAASVSVSQPRATAGETITFSVDIDDPQGVSSAYVELYPLRSVLGTARTVYLSKGEGNTWTGTYTVQATDEPGDWHIFRVVSYDTYQNSSDYCDQRHSQIRPLDFSGSDVEFYGTSPDVTPPAIDMSSLSVTPRRVGAGSAVTISVRATDNASGLKNCSIEIHGQGNSSLMYPLGQPDANGVFKATINTSYYPDTFVGECVVARVIVRDKAENESDYCDTRYYSGWPEDRIEADLSALDFTVVDPSSASDISGATVTLEKGPFMYTGEVFEPAVTVTLGDKTLVEGTDVEVEYQNNVNVGSAVAVVNGIGDYYGCVQKRFLIVPRPISDATVMPEEIVPVVYADEPAEPAVALAYGGRGLIEGTHYRVRYQNNDAIGEATITIAGRGNFTGTVTKSFQITAAPVPMFRLYNRWTYEHFYCSDPAERDKLISVGWTDEGIGWYAPTTGDPVYRLYNQYAPGGDHHYTMDKAEYDFLVSVGWTGEGIGWYSDPNQTVPVYREYNPYEKAHNHNYTPDKAEHDNLVSLGWKDEGIGWYGV